MYGVLVTWLAVLYSEELKVVSGLKCAKFSTFQQCIKGLVLKNNQPSNLTPPPPPLHHPL